MEGRSANFGLRLGDHNLKFLAYLDITPMTLKTASKPDYKIQ